MLALWAYTWLKLKRQSRFVAALQSHSGVGFTCRQRVQEQLEQQSRQASLERQRKRLLLSSDHTLQKRLEAASTADCRLPDTLCVFKICDIPKLPAQQSDEWAFCVFLWVVLCVCGTRSLQHGGLIRTAWVCRLALGGDADMAAKSLHSSRISIGSGGNKPAAIRHLFPGVAEGAKAATNTRLAAGSGTSPADQQVGHELLPYLDVLFCAKGLLFCAPSHGTFHSHRNAVVGIYQESGRSPRCLLNRYGGSEHPCLCAGI
jgi:hypothetical protein